MNTQLRAHKFAVERVLVLDNNIVSTNRGASLSAPYDNILDYTTGIYDIAAGQVGFLSKDDLTYNRILDAPDFASVKKFTIIQGTGKTNINTQDGHGYTQPPYVESMLIDTQLPYWFESAYAVNDIYASMKVTGYTGTEGLKNYILNINQTGVRLQHQNSMEMKDGFAITYRSPDYATLGTSAAQAKNDIYVNLAYKANLLSTEVKTLPVLSGNQPYVAFAIGGTTQVQSVTVNGVATSFNTPTLTQIATAANSYAITIPFMVVRRNGYDVMQYFTATTALREAIAKGIADSTLTGTERLKIIDTSTALTFATVDKLLFVALDNKLAVVTDQEPAVKTDIIVTAPSAANGNNPITLQPSSYLATAPTITRISGSAEPIGNGREWLIKYKTGAKNDAYTAQMYGWTYKYITIPDYVKEDVNYNVFILMHGVEVDDFSPKNDHYYITYILIPVMIPLTIATPGTNVAYATVTNGVITSTYFLPGQSGGSGGISISPIYGGSQVTINPTYSGGGLTALTITAGGSGYSNIAPIGSASVKSLALPAADCTTWLGAVLTAPENGTTVTFA